MSASWSMAGFWIVAAAAVALALAFMLPGLLRHRRDRLVRAERREANLAVYRDQMRDLKAELADAQLTEEQFLANKLELERRAAEDALLHEDSAPTDPSSRWLGIGLAAVVPVAAFGLYFWLGNPAVLSAIASGKPVGAAAAGATPTAEDILGMITQIEARTQSHPADVAAWEALGMANGLVARWPESVKAYEQAHRLQPGQPSILVGYAEALAMAGNQVLAGRPMELVAQALQSEPDNMKGLELAGIYAYQTRNFAQAIVFLDRLARQLPPESPHAKEVVAMRADAQRRLDGNATAEGPGSVPPFSQAAAAAAAGPVATGAPTGTPTATAAPTASPGAATAGGRVAGQVSVSDALKARIGPRDTLYIVARAPEGGPPLAATRVAVGSFPATFSLDDAMAMVPGNVLSRHREVTVVARISASGNPIAQPGDLEGRLTGVAVGSTGVKLVIDRIVP